jgi:lipid A 4'-phosphatase
VILGFSRFFWLSFIFFVALFILFPEIDIWFSSLFFKDGDFFLKHHFLTDFVYDFTRPVIVFYFLIFVFFLFKNPFNLKKRAITFILLCIIVAPGIVVNLGFKDHFGRARPRDIVQFNAIQYLSLQLPSSNSKSLQ